MIYRDFTLLILSPPVLLLLVLHNRLIGTGRVTGEGIVTLDSN